MQADRPRRRLFPGGLRWRLAASVAAVVVACYGVTFVAVYDGTGTQVRHEIDNELAGDASDFVAALQATHDPTAHRLAAAARVYVAAQPFSADSSLLFATVRGAPTAANRPELVNPDAPPDNGETFAEQAQENRLAARLMDAGPGFVTLPLPDVGDLRVFKRALILHGVGVTVGVGEPLGPVASAQEGVARAFVLAGLLTLLAALGAALLIGARFTRPLRRMAAIAARVDSGDLSPRITPAASSDDEVRVLADAFDRMLDRLTDAFESQRAFVADASHELRTPLTAIRGQLEVLAAAPEPTAEDIERVARLVQGEIARMTRLVDDLLTLARAEETQFLRVEPIDLPDYVVELWDGMTLIADRRFELGEVPTGTLLADPDRLAQALRNLIANAIEHTQEDTGVVRFAVRALSRDRISFVVQDDGPGIPTDQRERVFHRFYRTDPARDRRSGGTGLGLAIVHAIAEAHDGGVGAGESTLGGACIELELPEFRLARAAAPAPARSG